MSEWWLGLAPAEASIACGDAQHRLRWEAGRLRALDHDDVDGERALAALGGELCACVEMLGLWARHDEDVRVLVLASRGPSDALAMLEPEQTAGRGRLGRGMISGGFTISRGPSRAAASVGAMHSVPARVALIQPSPAAMRRGQAESELRALLRLGGRLPDRLAAGVAAVWRDRLERRVRAASTARPQLQAALVGRATVALREWLGPGSYEIAVEMLAGNEPPTLAKNGDRLLVELPFGWLVDVWAKGLASVGGRFCLEASAGAEGGLELLLVDPDLARQSRASLRPPSDGADASRSLCSLP